ncbi:MAG: T9SS type A sorting domain-containing protein [Candidatus Cloacimonadota bacterium]|nr:MAG: T9SS type A sorting domain-containing protein [Candidatus Cloacimonadota bacterium]
MRSRTSIFLILSAVVYMFGITGVNTLAQAADPPPIVWADTIDQGYEDKAYGVATDGLGNIIVTGRAYIGGNYDFFTVKYDSNGTILWADTVDMGDLDYAYGVATDGSGNIIVTGTSWIGGTYDFLTVKYDSNGTILWTDIVNPGGRSDCAYAVTTDSYDNIIVTGTAEIGMNNSDFYTVKYEPGGSVLWKDTINVGAWDRPLGIATDGSDNIIIAGYAYRGFANPSYDYYIIKYDSNGTVVWTDTINLGEHEYGLAVATDASDNFIVTGKAQSEPYGPHNFYTVKYNKYCIKQWSDLIDPGEDDEALGVATDVSGNIIVTGTAEIGGNNDYYTVKYDPNGIIQWTDIIDLGNDEEAYAVAIDVSGSIIVTGAARIGGNYDYYTVKYAPDPSFIEVTPEVITIDLSDISITPNPSLRNVYISYRVVSQKMIPVSLEVYDLLGRRMVTLVDKQHKGGTYRVNWDTKEFSQGIYFLKIKSGDYENVKKITLLSG